MRTASPAWGLYVHVPWCRVRCPYCAFHVVPDKGVPGARFVARVIEEVEQLRPLFAGAPATIYLGGGTPSRLPLPDLLHLLAALGPADEVTMEVNPEDLTASWLAAVCEAGVHRLSLGVQTLSGAHARRLGRAHTPEDTRRAATLLAGSPLRSWSADLMFGLAEQTLEELVSDLDAILALGPPHVSVYGLTIEPDTAYARAQERGRLTPAHDDLWRDMYAHLVQRLEAEGLERYEVSNFARAGHRSRHNEGYWGDRPYLGVGPSAHGYAPDGRRWVDRPDTEAWLAATAPVRTWEEPDALARATDRLVSGLRAREGLRLDALGTSTGLRPTASAVALLVRAGLLAERGHHVALTPEGFFVADGVVERLVHALAPVDPEGQSG